MLTGSFILLRFPMNRGGEEASRLLFTRSSITGALYLEKPSEIELYNGAFGASGTSALDESSSRDLIRQAAEGLRNG